MKWKKSINIPTENAFEEKHKYEGVIYGLIAVDLNNAMPNIVTICDYVKQVKWI